MPSPDLNLHAIQQARAALAQQRDAQRAAAVALQQAQTALDAMAQRTADPRMLENQQAAVQQLRAAAKVAVGSTQKQIRGIQDLSQQLLGESDPADLVQALPTSQPVMLLPVAVQTRYNDDATLLMVRIYPDAIHTFGHESGLTAPEVLEGKRYWEARFVTPDDTASPWIQLARIYSPARSAWIVRSTTPTNLDQLGQRFEGDGAPLASPHFNDDAIPLATRDAQTVYATALPDRFVVIGQASGREVFRKWGKTVADLLPMSPALDPLLVDDPANHDPFGADRAWMVDYSAALEAGMAVSITPQDLVRGARLSDRIDRLVVLGVDWTQTPASAAQLVASLLDNHQHSAGVSFIAQGIPTNNTSSTRAGYAANGADVAAALNPHTADQRAAASAVELTSAGARMQRLLGLPTEVFNAGVVPGADLLESANAGHMLNALWSATLGYTLRYFWNPLDSSKTLLSNDAVEQLRAWSVRYLRPGGPLSALRVGKQPYGILPISARGHVAAANAPMERELAQAIEWFRGFWDRAVPHVPTLRDPTAENLHQVLAMQPWATAKRYWEVAGPATVSNNADFAPFAMFQGLMLRGLIAELLDQQFFDTKVPFLSMCTVRPKPHALDAVPWVQRDPDQPQQELDGPVPLKRNYVASLLQLLSQPTATLRGPLTAMQNGESLLEAMLGFAADEELLQSGHSLFYGHLQSVGTVSATVKLQASRMGLAEYIGVHTSTLVGDQIEVNHARALLGLKLTGTTGNASIEEHIGAQLGLPRWQWPVHMQNIASFNDSLAFLQERTAGELQHAFRSTLDLFAQRLDAWITSLATHRLDSLREQQPQGLHLGAFSVVEDLLPDSARGQSQALDSLGYVHAPSLQQATAASVLRSGFLANKQAAGSAFDIDLRSLRVQRAKRLLEGVANGQSMAALLGYRFERALRDQQPSLSMYVLECRQAFPLRPAGADSSDEAKESIAARDVVDGVRLMDAYRNAKASFKVSGVPAALTQQGGAIALCIEDLLEQMDAVSDLLISESVYQMVGGNLDGAGAAMMTLDKQTRPPEPRVVETPHATRGYTQRVVVALESTDLGGWAGVADDELIARMEPRLNAWLARLFGDPANYAFTAKALTPPTDVGDGAGAGWIDSGIVLTAGIAELGLSPLALVLNSEAQQGGGHSGVQERLGTLMGDKLRAQLGAQADGMAVVLQADAAAEGQIGLVAFESLAWVFRRLLAKTRPLRRMDMVQAQDGVETSATVDDGEAAGVDIAELEARRDLAEAQADVVLSALAAASALAPEDLETLDPSAPATAALLLQTQTALAQAYRLGWRSATAAHAVAAGNAEGQALDGDDTAARAVGRARGLLAEIGGRLATARNAAVSDGLGGQMQAALNRIHAVMGKDFPLLPQFSLGAFAADAAASLADRDTLLAKAAQGNDDTAIAGWLPKLACVRENTALLSDALLAAEAVGAASGYQDEALDFQLLQLPRKADAHWAALPPAPGQDLRGVVAVAAHAPGALRALDTATRLAGLYVDEWMETIPSDSETTGLGFHFDAPGARPPQSILLAVPADPSTPSWTLDSLLATVNEAMALARVRAVRPQDLQGLGLLLPGIFLSNNFKQDVPSIDFTQMVSKSLNALRAASSHLGSGSATMAAGTTRFTS
ncbi:hypothetical protein [Rhodoferax sp.]|uniref:hypothetical protein n=1 Tax=Rhodoferax sp. TaxID=50421 RepID=UPI00374DDEE0